MLQASEFGTAYYHYDTPILRKVTDISFIGITSIISGSLDLVPWLDGLRLNFGLIRSLVCMGWGVREVWHGMALQLAVEFMGIFIDHERSHSCS